MKWLEMITALLLIFSPIPTWERIAVDQRRWPAVLWSCLVPLLLLGGAAEGCGLYYWGKPYGEVGRIRTFSLSEMLIYETAQFLLLLLVVFVGAKLIKALGETFHGRHSFNETFTVAAYGLSPLFLMRIFDVFPSLSPWVTWAVGICLCLGILYHGLPRVMRPDPPHAFGLYLMSILMLTMVSGLVRFVTAWYLKGKFPKVDLLISHVTSHLSF